MAKDTVPVKKTDTILTELDRLHQAISRRAYDLFRNGSTWGGAITDWLNAERELIAKPPVQLRQADGKFEVLAALPGIDAKDLDVQITPDDLLIKAETSSQSTTDKGTTHLREFGASTVFRSVHFPEKVDPDTVTAELKNGMLHLTAGIQKATTAKKVAIQAA